ncbi:MAG: hypothetical protein V2I76_15195 [Roseobacter sp.]|nr:hypothetical protein [Roseobacter sp.]
MERFTNAPVNHSVCFLVSAVTMAIAEKEISNSQDTPIFVGTRGVTTDNERVYVADNGSGDMFLRRAIELAGFANAEYVSLTNANA